jgi:hypothetical protein
LEIPSRSQHWNPSMSALFRIMTWSNRRVFVSECRQAGLDGRDSGRGS